VAQSTNRFVHDVEFGGGVHSGFGGNSLIFLPISVVPLFEGKTWLKKAEKVFDSRSGPGKVTGSV
jgi:hypothetical protein